jgi:two-component system, NtrC family, sensor kinase
VEEPRHSAHFDGPSAALQIRRGTQAGLPLHVAIVGGGKACSDLLHLLDAERLSRLRMKILGVFDRNPEAPGFRYAKGLNLFVTDQLEDLFALEGLNLIIELTGVPALQDEIYAKRPAGVSVMDHKAASLLWDLIQIEAKKTDLERKQQTMEQKSREQTQLILDSLPYRIMVVSMDLTIETVNRTFLNEHELRREEAVEKHCYEVRYGLDKPCSSYGKPCFVTDRIDEIKEKGFISNYREYKDERGETRFDVITIAPIYDDRGQLVHLLEASRDVTERMRLEREAQRSRTFFEKLIQSIVDGIVVVDTKGNVLIFNQGMEQLTGYSASEIMKKGHLASFYDIQVAKENMKKMRSDQFGPYGKLNPTSMTIRTKSGEVIPVTLSASLITIDGKEVGSVGVFTDMREILKIRKELEDANIQLIQSQKIASIGRMAAGVAHEINNPLSGILIYTELLKESLKDKPEYLKDLQEIVDQTLRCKRIASELLEFSRKSAGKISSFSLDDLISKCLALLINKASFQNIVVTTNIDMHMPNLTGDMSQLQQVFTNLFINASDAMDGKGKLHIRATFDRDRSLFLIQVADSGPGIPQECRDKIFDIFFTTKPAGKGTGLGLSVSQNILKIHGGHIAFDCPPEGGTVFTVELPLSPPGISSEGAVFIGEEPVFIE